MRSLRSNRLYRSIFFGAILTLSLVWILTSRVPADSTSIRRIAAPHQGFISPDFSLPSYDGEEISLSELKGRPVVMNFWATWCPPCRAEMPAMQRVFRDYEDRGLIVLAVNSINQDSLNAVGEFIEQYGLTFPILLDDQGVVANEYQIRSLPTTFFIDSKGVIREIVIGGPMSEALLRSRIENMLGELK